MTWAEILGATVGGFFKKIFNPEPVKPPKMLNKGDLLIDVSHHQGVINWTKVKNDPQGIKGAFIKASEGSTGTDSKTKVNVGGCVNNGLLWGCYHFATWNNKNVIADATQEAQHFIEVVKSLEPAYGKPTLPLVLDIESNTPIPYTKNEMVSYVSTFLNELKNSGYKTAIYGSPGFLNSYLPTNHPFVNEIIWLADYTGAINPVPGWKEINLRQYTEKGSVQGISGTVDMNKVLTPF